MPSAELIHDVSERIYQWFARWQYRRVLRKDIRRAEWELEDLEEDYDRRIYGATDSPLPLGQRINDQAPLMERMGRLNARIDQLRRELDAAR